MAGYKGGFGGFGGGNQMQQLMKQAQKMQEQMAKAQEELEEAEIVGERRVPSVMISMTAGRRFLWAVSRALARSAWVLTV